MTLANLALVCLLAGARPSPWIGAWTFDLCHEDRKPDHDKDTFCREGRDTIQVAPQGGGGYDITLCPSDPWGEKDVTIDAAGRKLSFRTRDGLEVRLTVGEDLVHFKGLFRTSDGHSGRIWGRRVTNCAGPSTR